MGAQVLDLYSMTIRNDMVKSHCELLGLSSGLIMFFLEVIF